MYKKDRLRLKTDVLPKASPKVMELRKMTTFASKTFDKNELAMTMKTTSKKGNKSPFQRGEKSSSNSTEYFRLAKGMLKESANSSLRNSNQLPVKLQLGKTNSIDDQAAHQENVMKSVSYMSSNSKSSTIRLVTDSESTSSLSQSIDPRKSSYRRQYCMQQKYGSRKIRKKQDIDQKPFGKSQSKLVKHGSLKCQ